MEPAIQLAGLDGLFFSWSKADNASLPKCSGTLMREENLDPNLIEESHALTSEQSLAHLDHLLGRCFHIEELSKQIDAAVNAAAADLQRLQTSCQNDIKSAEALQQAESKRVANSLSILELESAPPVPHTLTSLTKSDALAALESKPSVVRHQNEVVKFWSSYRDEYWKWAAGIACGFFLVASLVSPAVGLAICVVILVGFFSFIGEKISSARKKILQAKDEARELASLVRLQSAAYCDEARRLAEETHKSAAAKVDKDLTAKKTSLASDIKRLIPEIRTSIRELNKGLLRGDYLDREWQNWHEQTVVPDLLRVGTLSPDLPSFYRNFPGELLFSLPALVNYQSGKGLMIRGSNDLESSRDLAKNVIFRLLATVPAAGVKFAFVDPLSLGSNVSSFLALEKHEPTLIGGKVWSDPQHIDRALLEITEHMETVIQKYFREKYTTLESYNADARVKEAYRVVVVFDFPTNFTDTSARRLVSIMRNGPRCGVFPVVVFDPNMPLPYGFNIKELEAHALVLGEGSGHSVLPNTTTKPSFESLQDRPIHRSTSHNNEILVAKDERRLLATPDYQKEETNEPYSDAEEMEAPFLSLHDHSYVCIESLGEATTDLIETVLWTVQTDELELRGFYPQDLAAQVVEVPCVLPYAFESYSDAMRIAERLHEIGVVADVHDWEVASEYQLFDLIKESV